MTAEIFQQHRELLTGIAYRILGGVTDAEDVVQEAWLRWSRVGQDEIADPKAYLIRVVSRLAIDRLRQVKAHRETYAGPWLPEPIRTEPDVAELAELADSVEMALLVVLETLSPLERAVFVLREAFALPYGEIAEILGRSEAAVRQLSKRAREHVRERRPRFDVDRAERRRVTERFLGTTMDGDFDGLAGLLAPDAVLVADGGGKFMAPPKPVAGAEKVARLLLGFATERSIHRFLARAGIGEAAIGAQTAEVNGGPAVVITADGVPVTVFSLVVADGLIQAVYLIANPDKLARLS